MCGNRWLIVVLLLSRLAPAALAQPTLPDYSPPKDLSAGFEPNALLGADPKVKPPEDSWAAEVLKNKVWSGGVELGLAGSAGSANAFKVRAGLGAKRDKGGNVLMTDLFYVLAGAGGRLTEHKALWVLRDELQLDKSQWGLLLSEAIEFDQFRTYDLREALHAGVTRTWVKDERLLLKTRLGAGASYDLDTATLSDRWVPEGMWGYDVEYKLTERVRLASFGDYYPNMADPEQFRLRVRAAGEFLVVPEYGLVLRAGIQERFDSSPGGGSPNDIDYFTTVMMKY